MFRCDPRSTPHWWCCRSFAVELDCVAVFCGAALLESFGVCLAWQGVGSSGCETSRAPRPQLRGVGICPDRLFHTFYSWCSGRRYGLCHEHVGCLGALCAVDFCLQSVLPRWCRGRGLDRSCMCWAAVALGGPRCSIMCYGMGPSAQRKAHESAGGSRHNAGLCNDLPVFCCDVTYCPYLGRWRGTASSASMALLRLSGFAYGEKRSTTWPFRPIRNLVKFHLIAELKNPLRSSLSHT